LKLNSGEVSYCGLAGCETELWFGWWYLLLQRYLCMKEERREEKEREEKYRKERE
jgi:hypothetical protein